MQFLMCVYTIRSPHLKTLLTNILNNRLMKKVFYHLFFLLALAGCAKEEHVAVSDGVPGGAGFKFELTTENSTRAITDENFKTSFTEGDQVGLFVVSRTSGAAGKLLSSGNSVDNRRLTYSGGM